MRLKASPGFAENDGRTPNETLSGKPDTPHPGPASGCFINRYLPLGWLHLLIHPGDDPDQLARGIAEVGRTPALSQVTLATPFKSADF